MSHSPFVGLSNLEDAPWVRPLGSFGHIFATIFFQVIKRDGKMMKMAVICKRSFLEVAVFLATKGKIPMPHLTQPGWQDRDTFNFNEPRTWGRCLGLPRPKISDGGPVLFP